MSTEYENRKKTYSNRIRMVLMPKTALSDIKMPTILKLANYGTLGLEFFLPCSKIFFLKLLCIN